MQRDCGQSSGNHSRVHQITTVTLIHIISGEREEKKSTSVCLKANLGRKSAECDSLFLLPLVGRIRNPVPSLYSRLWATNARRQNCRGLISDGDNLFNPRLFRCCRFFRRVIYRLAQKKKKKATAPGGPVG